VADPFAPVTRAPAEPVKISPPTEAELPTRVDDDEFMMTEWKVFHVGTDIEGNPIVATDSGRVYRLFAV
jgi:hypothetical protein